MNPDGRHPEDSDPLAPQTDRQPIPPAVDQYGRPVEPADPVADESHARAVGDEILEDEVAEERFERAVKDEQLENHNTVLTILVVLALLLGATGLYLGLDANNKADEANERVARNAANSAVVRAEIARQLRAEGSALLAGQRDARSRATNARRLARSATRTANANANQIEVLRNQNRSLERAVSSLRAANQSTNQRIDLLQQSRQGSR
jgi:hypothetical protein